MRMPLGPMGRQTLLSLVVLVSTGTAQWSIEPILSTMYDDNVANNVLQVTDRMTTLRLNPGYGFGGERWEARLFYDGALNYYQTVTDMSNQIHSANLEMSFFSGEDDRNVLDLAAGLGQGLYRGSYSFYDNTQFTASLQYKQFLDDRIINTLGYRFRTIGFSQVNDLSYTEHALSGGFRFAMSTGTTLILQSDLGAKYYATANLASDGVHMQSEMFTLKPDVAQLTGMARIGQSIAEGTGLSLTAKYQWNIAKQSRFLSSSTGAISDDELFDDHYGYEGLQANVMLTQVLPGSVLVRLTGGVQNRFYSSLAAYDLDGIQLADQRIDNRSYVSLFLQKEFTNGFRLKAAFDFIKNSSNDTFYNYRNNVLALELSIPLE